jgi:hypothetical protein
MARGRTTALCGILILAVCLPALAGVRVTLRDGRVLEGREIDRDQALYLLQLESGTVLSLPAALVIQVEVLVEEPETAGDAAGAVAGEDRPGPSESERSASSGRADGLPGGLTTAEPRTLAGLPGAPRLPTLSEQLRVLRDSAARFQPGVISPYWKPTSDWADTPEINNNFNPARWYQAPIDPNWRPTNSLGDDVTQFNPTHWYQAPIDPTWWPTDGFAERDR